MKIRVCIAAVLCAISPILAIDFQGGSGTPDDPYQIATAQQLTAIGDDPNLLSMSFILVEDLDLDPNLPGGRVFDRAVIASGDLAFTGVFNGNDHAIRNLYIIGESNLGLFGYVDGNGEVVALGLLEAAVRGSGGSVGGLVGDNGGQITDCFCSGDISGGSRIGGLVGAHFGGNEYQFIDSCYSTCRVTGKETVGGLIGSHVAGRVTNSYSQGDVDGEERVGGLVGDLGSFGTISNSYSVGAVIGVESVGGLVGLHHGVISDCHSIGTVLGVESTGGLVGESFSRGEPAIVTDSFWDIEASGMATSDGGTGLTTAQMQDPNTFLLVGWDFIDEIANGNQEIWQMSAETGCPVLRVFHDYEPMRSGGLGTVEDPYLLTTAHELACIWFHPESHFRLEADVNLATATFGAAVIPWFGGSLDGQHHIIHNLHIIGADDPDQFAGANNLGLFGVLYEGASLQNFGVVDVNVTASGKYGSGMDIGALVGYSTGQMAGIYSSGKVQGRREVGGLVGENDGGSITECWSSANVTSEFVVGGLVGINRAGSVMHSFSAGEVNGISVPGGLIGDNRGDVTCCYSTAVVMGPSGGGLVGYNEGRIENCYSASSFDTTGGTVGGLVGLFPTGCIIWSIWDEDLSGPTTIAGGISRPTNAMMQADTFLRAGWDFIGEDENGTADIWWIDEGNDYPRLWWELPPEE